jgi:hypothetical protein
MRPIDCIVKIREESKLIDQVNQVMPPLVKELSASIVSDVVYCAQLVAPMELYKEQVCFLRVMLESEDPGHNDIALGALHKIFYMSYTVRVIWPHPSPVTPL